MAAGGSRCVWRAAAAYRSSIPFGGGEQMERQQGADRLLGLRVGQALSREEVEHSLTLRFVGLKKSILQQKC